LSLIGLYYVTSGAQKGTFVAQRVSDFCSSAGVPGT
jgi:hypothetical protein